MMFMLMETAKKHKFLRKGLKLTFKNQGIKGGTKMQQKTCIKNELLATRENT